MKIEHIQHYLPLVGIFVIGILGFGLFSYDKIFQFILSLALASSYITWGVMHHYLHKDLHISIILEYFAVALIGLVVMFSLIVRA